MILSIYLSGIWANVFNIFVTFRDIEYLAKLIIYQFIRNTCLYGMFGTPYIRLICKRV